jgi:dUTP pyrophosphatase
MRRRITHTADGQYGLNISVGFEEGPDVYLSDILNELNERLETLETTPTVRFKKLRPDAVLPEYKTPGAAGMDLVACVDEPVLLWPDAVACISTGLAMELPPGWEAQVRPRSGLAVKGVAVANAPGTVDCDYRGEVKVILRNHGEQLVVHKGDRIAQLVIARVAQAKLVEVDELSESVRGAGGFGSTGK